MIIIARNNKHSLDCLVIAEITVRELARELFNLYKPIVIDSRATDEISLLGDLGDSDRCLDAIKLGHRR